MSRLFERMWVSLVEKGIGSLFRPSQIRREGRANADVRRDDRLLLAQTERDADEVSSGRMSYDPNSRTLRALPAAQITEVSVKDAEPLSAVRARIEDSLLADGVRREVNIARTLLLAEEIAGEDATEPQPSKPDSDWLFRWRDSAAGVSDSEVQEIWARVLVGEFKSPGSFSLRTLECLRTLSAADAARIAKLAPFTIGKRYVYRNKMLENQRGLTVELMLVLQDLGVVAGVEARQLMWSLAPDASKKEAFFSGVASGSRGLLVTHSDRNANLSIPTYWLTGVGRELMRLIPFEPDEEMLRTVARELKAKGCTCYLADCREDESQGTTVFENAQELT